MSNPANVRFKPLNHLCDLRNTIGAMLLPELCRYLAQNYPAAVPLVECLEEKGRLRSHNPHVLVAIDPDNNYLYVSPPLNNYGEYMSNTANCFDFGIEPQDYVVFPHTERFDPAARLTEMRQRLDDLQMEDTTGFLLNLRKQGEPVFYSMSNWEAATGALEPCGDWPLQEFKYVPARAIQTQHDEAHDGTPLIFLQQDERYMLARITCRDKELRAAAVARYLAATAPRSATVTTLVDVTGKYGKAGLEYAEIFLGTGDCTGYTDFWKLADDLLSPSQHGLPTVRVYAHFGYRGYTAVIHDEQILCASDTTSPLQQVPYDMLCDCVGVTLTQSELEMDTDFFTRHMETVLARGVRRRMVDVSCPVCKGTGKKPQP